MKSEVRRSDFHAFGFCSFKKNSELSATNKKEKRKIVNIALKGKHNE